MTHAAVAETVAVLRGSDMAIEITLRTVNVTRVQAQGLVHTGPNGARASSPGRGMAGITGQIWNVVEAGGRVPVADASDGE